MNHRQTLGFVITAASATTQLSRLSHHISHTYIYHQNLAKIFAHHPHSTSMGLLNSRVSGTAHRYIPTRYDVHRVRMILLRWLPLELALKILEEAEYWPRASWSVDGPWTITYDRGSVCCLLTPKISEWINYDGHFMIRRVNFKITSHDQGWCRDHDFISKYMGSWTWFEAAIVRDFLPEQAALGDVTHHIQETIRTRNSSGSSNNMGHLVTVTNPKKPETDVWHIQRNIRALEDETIHEVFWTDVDATDDIDEMNFIDMTGSGRGGGFVKSLQPHDQIAVIGRAMFPAWTNHVQSIEIEILYST